MVSNRIKILQKKRNIKKKIQERTLLNITNILDLEEFMINEYNLYNGNYTEEISRAKCFTCLQKTSTLHNDIIECDLCHNIHHINCHNYEISDIEKRRIIDGDENETWYCDLCLEIATYYNLELPLIRNNYYLNIIPEKFIFFRNKWSYQLTKNVCLELYMNGEKRVYHNISVLEADPDVESESESDSELE